MTGPGFSATGKVVLVTGATSGIGLETARGLARAGAHVIVGARDRARGQTIVDELRRGGAAAELLVVDLASFASIRAAARRLRSTHERLDVLVNNAGIATRHRQMSPDGHELTWATNFLGPFLLTREILPLLRLAPGSRVVNVSSAAHATGHLAWEDLDLTRGFRSFKAYAQSKLALVLFTQELARREPWLHVTAVHPGAIATNIWRAAPRWVQLLLALVLPNAARGAQPVIALAAARELPGRSGQYFDRQRPVAPAARATGAADAARLWDVAARATEGRDVR